MRADAPMSNVAWSDDELGKLAARVIAGFGSAGLTIATCESITAGGIGWTLTRVPGASQVFRGGLMTYASDLKASLAGVDAGFIAANGVINERTACQMAAGAAQACGADVVVSVTGVAGPDGEDGALPGTVWCGLSYKGLTTAHCVQFSGDRDAVRRATIGQALYDLLSALENLCN